MRDHVSEVQWMLAILRVGLVNLKENNKEEKKGTILTNGEHARSLRIHTWDKRLNPIPIGMYTPINMTWAHTSCMIRIEWSFGPPEPFRLNDPTDTRSLTCQVLILQKVLLIYVHASLIKILYFSCYISL